MDLQVVQLLLQLDEPLRCQVNIFQHDPTTRLARGVDHFVSLGEALSGAYARKVQIQSIKKKILLKFAFFTNTAKERDRQTPTLT